MRKQFRHKKIITGFFILNVLVMPLVLRAETSVIEAEQNRTALQQQLDVLQKEIDELDGKLSVAEKDKTTLAREINILNTEMKKRQLEVKRISLAITEADGEIKQKNHDITNINAHISRIKSEMAENLSVLHKKQTSSILEALLQYASLGEFFYAVDSLENVQAEIQNEMRELHNARNSEQKAKDELEDFRAQQLSLRSLQELEKRVIERNKKTKDEILRLTKGKEALFQSIISQKKKNLAALKSQLFYLERTGVSAEEALKFAKLAADRAGIRVAFLLALLEVETGRQYENGIITAGTYIGTGNWKTDLYDCYVRLGKRSTAESQKAALFEITERLGFDPDKMPVSRKPSYGCGGAVGPAQFLPSTWLIFENRVGELTNHRPPNPWNIEDAFTAAAIFLKDAGADAKSESGEKRAAQTYISGRPNCPTKGSARSACLWYAKQVLSLAKEIDNSID